MLKGKEQSVALKGYLHVGTSDADPSYLIGSKCKICGFVTFPKRPVCPLCLKEKSMEEVPLGTRGVIHAFCVTRVTSPGFSAPSIHAWVDLEHGPRVFAVITGCETSEDALKVGQEVELIVEKLFADEQGNDVLGYKFKPVNA